MTAESWSLVFGLLLGLGPLLLLVAVKKLKRAGIRPDKTIVYQRHGTQALRLHVFRPRNRIGAAPGPAILLFHGGRWLYGSPEQLYPQCQYFAARGFTCFCADYRLGTGNVADVRGAVGDAQSAFQYLVHHARELGIDAGNIAVGGGSAGGQLAAALGSGLPQKFGADGVAISGRPAALFLYNPMLDLSPGTPDHLLVVDCWREVSPFHHIDASVPPTLILLGSQDPEVPLATAQAYCDAVTNAGGHCEIALYEGQGHGFFNHPPYLEQTNQRVLEFLEKVGLR